MKHSCPYLAVLFLCLGPAVAMGQRARTTRPEQAFYAPRHLHELAASPSDGVARATGDLDNDGDLDLLTIRRAEFWPIGVQTWRNEGRVDFQPAHALDFPPEDHVHYELAGKVVLADVTGDGWLDFAYDRLSQNQNPGTGVVVHPGLGDGSFGAGTLIPGTPRMYQFLVGDCDGDGDPDLLVQGLNWPGSTSFLTWWSFQAGSFVPGPSLEVLGGQLIAVDVDANGIADIAMTSSAPEYDAIQIFRTVNGALTTSDVIPGGMPALDLRLQTGDLEGDGDEDLLSIYRDISSLQPRNFYLRPIRNDGGTFTALPVQTFPQPPTIDGGDYLSLGGVLADWDADGDADFVSPRFGWMENTGEASFHLAARQNSGIVSSYPLHVVDLNDDGHLDALIGSVCQFGDSRFPVRSSSTPEPFGPLRHPAWRELADWEGDGDLDLLAPEHLYLNNGDGSFVNRPTPFPNVPGDSAAFERAWGDFDGDGLRDVVAALIAYPPAFTGMVLFTGREDGTYEISSTVPSTREIDAGVAGDIDGDGDLDILSTDGWWQNSGTGEFGGWKHATYAGQPLLARDADEDHDLDFLVRSGTRLKLCRNLGGGLTFAEDLGPSLAGILPAFLDVDQDGDLDVVVSRPSTEVVSVHEQLPQGGFAASFELAAPRVAGPVGQIDVDGDARLDLVVGLGDTTWANLAVWFREPGLAFSERREWAVRLLARAFGDVDRDGDVEPIGDRPLENFRFDGPADGLAVQYGLDGATSGTGGWHPVLGSGGPVRRGCELRLAIGRGRGGASGVLLRGTAPDDVLTGGFRNLVAAPQSVRSFVLGGDPGAPGAGSIVIRTPVGVALVGLTFYYQAVLVDPGASAGLSATNGLEIRYGDGQ